MSYTSSSAVTIKNGSAGGTASTDESAFVAGTTQGTPLMAEDPNTGQLLVVQTSPGTRILQVAASVSVAAVTSNTSTAPAQTVVGTTASQVLAANNTRKRMMLQNCGTTVIKISLGAVSPTQSAFHFALAPGGTTADGSSQIFQDTMWQGAIQAISSGVGGILNVTELT